MLIYPTLCSFRVISHCLSSSPGHCTLSYLMRPCFVSPHPVLFSPTLSWYIPTYPLRPFLIGRRKRKRKRKNFLFRSVPNSVSSPYRTSENGKGTESKGSISVGYPGLRKRCSFFVAAILFPKSEKSRLPIPFPFS